MDAFTELLEARRRRRLRVKPPPSLPPSPTVQEPAINRIAREKSASKDHIVQMLLLDKYQMYGIEVAKALTMRENRWMVDAIFKDWAERGCEKPFGNKSVRTRMLKPGYVEELKPCVRTQRPIKWYVNWQHRREVPGFVSYSEFPFKDDGCWCRLADIDIWEIHHYCDRAEFEHYYNTIVDANLNARKIEFGEVNKLQGFCKEAAKSIGDQLGTMYVYYTGGGFRALVREANLDDLTAKLIGLQERKMVCQSSTTDWYPQKLFSAQLMKPHFQTDISPTSAHFKFSNPAFKVIRYDKHPGLLELAYEYFQSYKKKNYQVESWRGGRGTYTKEDMVGLYNEMRERQVGLEDKIINSLRGS